MNTTFEQITTLDGLPQLMKDVFAVNDKNGFWPATPRPADEIRALICSEGSECLEALRKEDTIANRLLANGMGGRPIEELFEWLLEIKNNEQDPVVYQKVFADLLKDTTSAELADMAIRSADAMQGLMLDRIEGYETESEESVAKTYFQALTERYLDQFQNGAMSEAIPSFITQLITAQMAALGVTAILEEDGSITYEAMRLEQSVCFVFAFCIFAGNQAGIDMLKLIELVLHNNRLREHKHGGKSF